MRESLQPRRLLIQRRSIQELDLGEERVLKRGPQRHQRVGHQQRHLTRDRSQAVHHGLTERARWVLNQPDYAIRLGLVVKEQVGDLPDQLVRVRQRRRDAEVALREPMELSGPSRRDPMRRPHPHP